MRQGWHRESWRHSLAARGIRTSYYRPKTRYVDPIHTEKFTINVEKDFPLNVDQLRAKYPGINEESLKNLDLTPEERAAKIKAAEAVLADPDYRQAKEDAIKEYEFQIKLQKEKNIAEQNRLLAEQIMLVKRQLKKASDTLYRSEEF